MRPAPWTDGKRFSNVAVALGLLALVLVGGTNLSHAQIRPAQMSTLPANICSTQWGWCHLPTLTAPNGVACTCLTTQNQQVPGITRYYPYQGPPSPYLQPHTSPPATIR
jgi:hypothetical protein